MLFLNCAKLKCMPDVYRLSCTLHNTARKGGMTCGLDVVWTHSWYNLPSLATQVSILNTLKLLTFGRVCDTTLNHCVDNAGKRTTPFAHPMLLSTQVT